MPPEEKGIQEYREQADALAYFEGAALILGSFLRFSMRPSLVTLNERGPSHRRIVLDHSGFRLRNTNGWVAGWSRWPDVECARRRTSLL
jgi:hypothetical protein